MSFNVEYRSVIKFLLLRHTESVSIVTQVQETYGEKAPSRATIYNWIREFRNGRDSVFDDDRVGRPLEIGDDKLTACALLVKESRRISVHELSLQLKIGQGSTHRLLQELGIRKLCSRFVPKFLTGEMCEKRLLCCQSNLELFDKSGDKFLSNIVTVDESPVSLYVPESKRESIEWKFPGELASRKLKSFKSNSREAMLTVFWDINGILKIDYLDRGSTINGQYYSDMIKDVRKLRRKSRGVPLWLLHDNAPIHKSGVATSSIDDMGFVPLQHPPYSPDLAPSDFHLFRHLKKEIRGHHFEDRDILKERVTGILMDLKPEFFEQGFQELVRRWRKCVEKNGSYIEK